MVISIELNRIVLKFLQRSTELEIKLLIIVTKQYYREINFIQYLNKFSVLFY